MLNFTRLTKENLSEIVEYLYLYPANYNDLTFGSKFVWGEDFIIDYAFYNGFFIMKETSSTYKNAFYYPVRLTDDADYDGVFLAIENYAKENNIELKFCYIDNQMLADLKTRYPFNKHYFNRDWCDYIYEKENFIDYPGKKLSKQRNHVNKFKKTYPEYLFKPILSHDLDRVDSFIKEFYLNNDIVSDGKLSSWTELKEKERSFSFIKKAIEKGLFAGYIEIDGKIVGLSVAEKRGDTLVVHIEKALKNYDGIYPTLASEIVKAFADESVKFINREEDCGDEGLRISKTRYRPIEIKEKHVFTPLTAIDFISSDIEIKTDRLTITEIRESDKEEYYRLYIDDELNKYWGYDYREDLFDKEPTPEHFYLFSRQMIETKEEYSLAIRLDGKFIGELVVWNLELNGTVETGFRLLKEYHKKGYAGESVLGLINYLNQKLGIKKVKSRCHKQNLPSYNMLTRLGYTVYKEYGDWLFFEKYL